MREWFENLLQDDKRMALMALSKFESDPMRYRSPLSAEVVRQHEEVEEMLSPYLLDFYLLESTYEVLREMVSSSEDSVLMKLDIVRNKLLLANTLISIVAVNFAFGSFISGIFGMNLDNTQTIQPIKNSFEIVAITTILAIAIGIILSILLLCLNGTLPSFDATCFPE